MDKNGGGDSTITATSNDHTLSPNNHRDCNANRSAYHIVDGGTPTDRRDPAQLRKRKASTAAKGTTRKSKRVKTALLEHLAGNSEV